METPLRTIAKALSWQAMGLVVMTGITFAITGSFAEGGLVAMLGAATGMVSYIFHERMWAKISWGRTGDQSPLPSSNRRGG